MSIEASNSTAKITFFSLAILMGVIAESMIIFATPLIILDLTGAPSAAGLAFAVEWLPAVLVFPFAGVIADRLGGKRVFILSAIVRSMALCAFLFIIYLKPEWTVPLLMMNAGVMSVFMAPNRMSVEKLVPKIASLRNLPIIQSAVQNSELLAFTAGPALSAYLVLSWNKTSILLLASVAFALSILPILLLKVTDGETEGLVKLQQNSSPVASIWSDMRQGVTMLWANAALMNLACLNCTINLTFAVALASHAAIITSTFGLNDSAYGVLNSVAGGFALLNLLLMPLILKKIMIFHLGVAGLMMVLAGFFALSLVDTYSHYLLGFVVVTIGISCFNIFNRTQRIKALSKEHIGKVMGPFYVMNLAALPLGGLIVALFADQHGNQILILLSTLLLLIVGPILIVNAQRSFERVFAQLDIAGNLSKQP